MDFSLRPSFVIEYCINCGTHSWCTRHDEKKYLNIAQSVAAAIKEMVPGFAEGKYKVYLGSFAYNLAQDGQCVLANGQTRGYQTTHHMVNIANANPMQVPMDTEFPLRKMPIGALEVYFMGVRLFSKVQSGVWPNATRVAERCLAAFNDFENNQDISDYETVRIARSQRREEDYGVTSQAYLSAEETEMMAMMSQGGMSQMGYKTSGGNFRSGGAAAAPRPEKVVVRGRKITLGECKFVFDRIWKATIECGHDHAHEDAPADHIHPKDREHNIIMVDDLFHIVDLAGQLLNKADPEDHDTRPYDEFLKHALTQAVHDKDGKNPHIVQFVPAEEMPKVIYGIFICQPDKKRLDAAQLVMKYAEEDLKNQPKQLMEHIIEQVWQQYDTNQSGVLERDQAFNFIGMVLEIKERTLASEEGRQPADIKEEDVEGVFEKCDIDHDGNLSKEEMKQWLFKYLSANPEKEQRVINIIKKKQETENTGTGAQQTTAAAAESKPAVQAQPEAPKAAAPAQAAPAKN